MQLQLFQAQLCHLPTGLSVAKWYTGDVTGEIHLLGLLVSICGCLKLEAQWMFVSTLWMTVAGDIFALSKTKDATRSVVWIFRWSQSKGKWWSKRGLLICKTESTMFWKNMCQPCWGDPTWTLVDYRIHHTSERLIPAKTQTYFTDYLDFIYKVEYVARVRKMKDNAMTSTD